MDDESARPWERGRHNPDDRGTTSRARGGRESSERRPRRRRGPDELSPEEESGAGRRRARAAGSVLLAGWLIVSAMDALALRTAIGHAIGPGPVDPKSMWAWNELGEFFLWASAVIAPLCALGIASAVRLRRLRGYWAATVSSLVLLPLTVVGGVVCPMLWLAPVTALMILSDGRVRRVCRPAHAADARSPGRTEPAPVSDRAPDDEELIRELRRAARRRVALPAGAMLLMAAFGGCMSGVLLGLSLTGPKPESGLLSIPFVGALGGFGLLWCAFIGYGAWEMDRLGSYRVARAAAWAAVVPVPIPLYLLWLAGAVAGLVALNDAAVRAAFATGNGSARAVYLEDHADQLRRRIARRSRDD